MCTVHFNGWDLCAFQHHGVDWQYTGSTFLFNWRLCWPHFGSILGPHHLFHILHLRVILSCYLKSHTKIELLQPCCRRFWVPWFSGSEPERVEAETGERDQLNGRHGGQETASLVFSFPSTNIRNNWVCHKCTNTATITCY